MCKLSTILHSLNMGYFIHNCESIVLFKIIHNTHLTTQYEFKYTTIELSSEFTHY